MVKIRSLYLKDRLFATAGLLFFLLITTHFFEVFFVVAEVFFYAFAGLVLLDIAILYLSKGHVVAFRSLPEKFSLGDENEVYIAIHNTFSFATNITIIDELPAQLQTFLKKLNKIN